MHALGDSTNPHALSEQQQCFHKGLRWTLAVPAAHTLPVGCATVTVAAQPAWARLAHTQRTTGFPQLAVLWCLDL